MRLYGFLRAARGRIGIGRRGQAFDRPALGEAELLHTQPISGPAVNEDELQRWLESPAVNRLPPDEVLEAFHSQHPRSLFIKGLKADASVLDVGAGDGVLNIFRHWPKPARPDLAVFAYSMEKGANFDDYDGYELSDWNISKPFDGKSFDAVYCSHFIEHIQNPCNFLSWSASKLTSEGRIYIEWPSEYSRYAPKNLELSAWGISGLTGNYFDDPTHQRKLPDRSALVNTLRLHGFEIEASGLVCMPLFEDELLARSQSEGDRVALQFAYWLKTRWCQFITAKRINQQ